MSRYTELKEKQHKYSNEGIFYAFSQQQFDEGMARAKKHMKEGDEIVSFYGGGYGIKRCIKEMYDYWDAIDKQIAQECDPQEVYDYEYCNYETDINPDGDTNSIEIVAEIFGYDVAERIKRKRVKYSIPQLKLRHERFDVPGLTLQDGSVPDYMYFGYEDGKAFCMMGCKLYPVMLNGEQYVAPDELWYGMNAHYKNGKIYKFYKD